MRAKILRENTRLTDKSLVFGAEHHASKIVDEEIGLTLKAHDKAYNHEQRMNKLKQKSKK